MGNINEILNKAEGNKELPNMLYFKYEGDHCLSFDITTGEMRNIYEDNIPADVKVIQALKLVTVTGTVCYVTDNDYNYTLTIYKQGYKYPVLELGFDKPEVEFAGNTWDLIYLMKTKKFLGLSTSAEGNPDENGVCRVYGSNMYLKWDGERYIREVGQLDDWFAGERSPEYVLSEDGERLERIYQPEVVE